MSLCHCMYKCVESYGFEALSLDMGKDHTDPGAVNEHLKNNVRHPGFNICQAKLDMHSRIISDCCVQ